MQDAIFQLGGIPFDNSWKWYVGSTNDLRLNPRVKRFKADTTAILEMKVNYNTSGQLEMPLITMHTTKDQQGISYQTDGYQLEAVFR